MVSISFGAGCFHAAYHIGVLEELNKYSNIINNTTVFHGSSCGAIIAVCAICNIALYDTFMASLEKVNKTQDLIPILKDVLVEILPEKVHILCSNRCYIYMTNMETMEPYIVNHFHSKTDVINAIIGSCFIPMVTISSYNYYYRGKPVIDGSIVSLNPDADIKISCIADNLIQYLPIKNKIQSIKNITICCPFTPKTLIWSIRKGPVLYYENIYNHGKNDTRNFVSSLSKAYIST
jgi:hypothetical protein